MRTETRSAVIVTIKSDKSGSDQKRRLKIYTYLFLAKIPIWIFQNALRLWKMLRTINRKSLWQHYTGKVHAAHNVLSSFWQQSISSRAIIKWLMKSLKSLRPEENIKLKSFMFANMFPRIRSDFQNVVKTFLFQN